MFWSPFVTMFREVFFEGYCVFVIYPSKNTTLNMVTKGDRNMYVYNVYTVILRKFTHLHMHLLVLFS